MRLSGDDRVYVVQTNSEDGDRAVLERKGKPGQHVALAKRDPTQPLRGHNVRYGFVYKKVPHITLGSIANNEPAEEETLYDQPLEDKKRLRVAGPFTVETLQSYEPISPEELARQREQVEELAAFEGGITELSRSFGHFQVSIVRMHDDLLQEGLLKRDKKAASFVTIGEPDIRLHKGGANRPGEPSAATVEIAGLDIYDPIRDEVQSRDVHDIAYWMLDDAYDGSNFVVRQVFFCGGDKDEFDQWKRELNNLAAAAAKKKAEQTLRIQIDDEAFATAYGHTSRPFPFKTGQKVAVRVVSQFGEETTKVLQATTKGSGE